ncbi:MAG: ATP-binding protein [Planctomycetota bacterium]
MIARTSQSLLGRVVLLIGLSLFTVELAVLAVFTAFAYGERVADRSDKLDRYATRIREDVRAALLGRTLDDATIERQLSQAMASGEQNPSAPPSPQVAAVDFPVEVWVFTEARGRRYRSGRLTDEAPWSGPWPPDVKELSQSGELPGKALEDAERLARVEPIPSGDNGPPAGVLYVQTELQDLRWQVIQSSLIAFAAGAIAVFVTALVTLFYLRRALLRPLSQMVRADNAARGGDHEAALVPADAIPNDEVGAIMRSRNRLYLNMIAAQQDLDRKNALLAEQREELRVWGHRLEKLVGEKTQALLHARDRLHQTEKLAALGRLAANVAHEINNPLASIAGYAEAAREDLKDGLQDDVDSMLTTIEEQAYRCKDILKRLLGLARADALESEPVALRSLIEATLSLAETRAEQRGVTLELAETPADLGVKSDPGALQQVVLNLVENAIDAAAANGEPAWVRVRALAIDERAVLEVQDSGQGIPPEIAARVFDPFYTTKPIGRGTGLGLAICQSLVEHLGGQLELDPGQGERGATFRVTLPGRLFDTSAVQPPLPISA